MVREHSQLMSAIRKPQNRGYCPGMEYDDIQGHDSATIALRMRLVRKALGLTQAEFSERTGLKGGALANYETGRNRPDLDAVASLIQALGLTSDWIYFGDPSALPHGLWTKISALLATMPKQP